MPSRVWDPEEKYKEGFVKSYSHWTLEVSFRQHTLGCFIIFANRHTEKISELENEEIIELKDVMKELEYTLSKIDSFKPDRFNYLQMGNALHHLHFHAIPRYANTRNFMNKTWEDSTYGHPPQWTKEESEKDLILRIKDKFLAHL
ncbi:MAG: adenylyltransferase [Patescibacteria group bacterium]|jgi:diadenosine tetraphosphate (Ap4A) HIT family hydrolase|nr:adenylyltransferase [Patescibacteria group bacterium]